MRSKLNWLIKCVREMITTVLFFAAVSICEAQSSFYLVKEATNALHNNEIEQGTEILRRVIQSDKSHAGQRILNELPESIPDGELLRGKHQFRSMTEDLPLMKSYSGSNGFQEISNWVIRKFAGESIDFKVDWDKGTPILSVYGVEAENVGPSNSANAKIRVKSVVVDASGKENDLGFEQAWHHVVFELLNLRQFNRVTELDRQASQGELTRAEYVQAMFYLEHETVQMLQGFYVRYFLPWSLECRFKSDPEIWYVEQPGWWQPADQFINDFPFNATYPWKIFGDRFDAIRFRAISTRGKTPVRIGDGQK